jgi:D-aminoacyl-tRNA deacylase
MNFFQPLLLMITIIQRVTQASVTIDGITVGRTNQGIMALLAVEKEDSEKQADRLLERILNYRIFSDNEGKMNLSLRDIDGGLLLVPQFTLAANTDKGNRPSFASGAKPEHGRALFSYIQQQAGQLHPATEFGRFGADMQVALINDGPVTFTLKVN